MPPSSDTPKWRRVDELFEEILDLPRGDRRARLAEVRADAPELADEVLELLDAAERAGPFLERARDGLAAAADAAFPPASGPLARDGERIGAYRLVRELGRGGMGEVHLAERADGAFEREVALKLLGRGLEGENRLARFLEERQILATLEHPNIARLMDGGATEDGRPYLVMERVEGTPITEHCRERALDLEERLALFDEVAAAVEHAHHNLVVHRDLKPSNILVTPEGRVKLLDFGIAGLLEDGRAAGPGAPGSFRALTPEYASPEQLAGEPVGTSSDIYQLGALLYELLSGRRPWAPAGGAAAAARTLTGEPPPPPSRAARAAGDAPVPPARLRGDLDAIALRALRRDPGNRYASVEALRADLERRRERLPVRARDDGWRYRAGRFVSRNRWAVAAAAAFVLLAGGYGVTVTAYAARLEHQRDVARRESEKSEEVQAFLVDLFRRPDPFGTDSASGDPDLTVREALDLGLERVRTELSSRPDVQATLLGNLADVYANLGLTERALDAQRDALRATRTAWGEGSPRVLEAVKPLADRYWELGRNAPAESLYRREYLPLADSLYGPGSPQAAAGLVGLGRALSGESRLEAAEAVMDSAARIYEASASEQPGRRADLLHNLSLVRHRMGLEREAEEAAREAVSLWEEILGPDHPRTAIGLTALANALAGQGRDEEAEEADRRALSIFERRLGPTHDYTLRARNNLATQAFAAGRYEEAIRQHRRILEAMKDKYGPRSVDAANSLQNLAASLLRAGRLEEAAADARRAEEIYRETLGTHHFRTGLPLLTLAEIHLDRSAWEEAAGAAREAASILEDALPEGHYVTAVARGRLGRALAGQERFRDARPLLEEAYHALEEGPGAAAPYRREMLRALVDLYERWGRPAEAGRYRELLADASPTGEDA